MPAPDLEYIDVSDFTPGIYSRFGLGSQSAPTPPGAAQETNTYRCVGYATGGLGPAPRRVTANTKSGLDFLTDASANVLDGGKVRQLAFFALVPVSVGPGANRTATPDKLFVIWEYFYNNGGVTERRTKALVIGVYDTTNPLYTMRSYVNVEAVGTEFSTAFYTSSRTNNTTPTNPGIPIVVGMVMYPGGSIAGYRETWTYPAFATPAADSVASLLTDTRDGLVAHQGRVVTFKYASESVGATGAIPNNERLGWFPVNNVGGAVSADSVFVEENPSGYSSWGAMNANELFLLKQVGGAVVVRGDLDNPTVIRLPGVAPAYVKSKAAATPIGLVYGSRSGVYVWEGGDTATLLSPQMDKGNFWIPDRSLGFLGDVGSFCNWMPYILAPKNWMYDTRTKAWWRLDDVNTRELAWYSAGLTGYIWAGPAYWTVASPTMAEMYDPTLGASDYSWFSQPIPATQNRVINIREIQVLLQGYGTVAVTLTGLDGATITETFTVNSTAQPKLFRANCKLQGTDITVKIVSTGNDVNTDAPSVYAVRIGHTQRMKVAVNA